MAFGNLSQNDRFNRNQGQPVASGLSGKSDDDLAKYNPDFKTVSQNDFGDHAPTEKELKDNETREVKAPNDRYKNADLKEIFKLRSAFLIAAIWILVHFALVVFADGQPDNWYSMMFNPERLPGFLGTMAQPGGAWAYIAGIIQIIFASCLAPFMFTSWFQFLLNLIVLVLLCWSAKVVRVDDMRLFKTCLITSIGSSLIVYGLFRLTMLSFTITGIAQGTWVEALQQSTVGIYGLKIGIVGLWIFVVMQVMFERGQISAFAQGMEKKRSNRTKVLILDIIIGIVYLFTLARPGKLPLMSLMLFSWLLIATSILIGAIRGLISYSTLALARQHGRL